MTESELIERCRSGDERAYRTLYEQHAPRAWRLAYRLLEDEEAARESVQDAFVRAYHRLDQFRGESAFATWLHTVVVRVALNRRERLRTRRKRELPLVDLPQEARAPSPTTPAPTVRRRIRGAIAELPDIYRTVFVMYDMEGFTHEEIADRLEIAVGTSKARLSRARGRLREVLGDLIEECVG